MEERENRSLINIEREIKVILSKLSEIKGVIFVFIIRKDGVLPAITSLSVEEEWLANFSSSCAGIYGGHLVQHEIMNEPSPKQILAETESSKIILYDVEKEYLLVVKTLNKVNLGLLRFSIRRNAETLRELLEKRREEIKRVEVSIKEKLSAAGDLESALKRFSGMKSGST